MFLNKDAKKEKAILNKINFVRNQDRCIYSFAVFVFIIFLIPNDVLTNYPFLQSFTDLIAGIIPGIDVLSNASKLNEALRLYLSLLWVVGSVFFLGLVLNYINLFISIALNKFTDEEQSFLKDNNDKEVKSVFNHFAIWFFIIGIVFLALLRLYDGSIVESERLILHTLNMIQSRLGIAWFGLFIGFAWAIFLPSVIMIYLYWLVFNNINYNEGEKDVTDNFKRIE
jgi:hypothetical protein